jgi:hypothetical protein
VTPKQRARTAAEMMSELKLQAAASVTPVRATSWNAPNSAGRPVMPKPRARKAAEMMIELRLQAVASVKPVRAMSCMCAEQREAACAAQAEGENSG